MEQSHDLKIAQEYFNNLVNGRKKCEIRFNDRDYQVGDILIFRIINEGKEFPCAETFRITHILVFADGLKDRYVALSVEQILNK